MSKNLDEVELNVVIGKFDLIVWCFMSDCEYIDNLYRIKDAAAEVAKRAYTKEMESVMNVMLLFGELNMLRDCFGDVYGDEDDDVFEDFMDDVEKS